MYPFLSSNNASSLVNKYADYEMTHPVLLNQFTDIHETKQ